MGEGTTTQDRSDRLLAPTYWTAVCIVPVLGAAWTILYLFFGDTKKLWAWTINAPMSCLVMGGGYISGAYFFTRVAVGKRWHRVAPGFLGTTMFTTILLAATVLHWDKFNHDHVSFWAWLTLYIVTPPLLPWLWRNNQRTDPGTPEPDEVIIPRTLRRLVTIGGSLQLTIALLMFAFPEKLVKSFPWAVTPLTVRSISAYVAFPAIAWIWFAFEERWSSFRITMQTATLGLVLIGIGALRVRDTFTGPSWSKWGFVVALSTMIGLLLWLQLAMDGRRGRPADP